MAEKEIEQYKKKSVVGKITKHKKRTLFARLNPFCLFAKEHDYIEVTEWKNCEGFDVDVNSIKRERFQLTYGEWRALKELVKKLYK